MMGDSDEDVVDAQIVVDDAQITLTTFCDRACVTTQLAIEMVDHGILNPVNTKQEPLCFAETEVRRAQIALRLHRDLGVNLAGAALALELMDEIRALKKHTNRL